MKPIIHILAIVLMISCENSSDKNNSIDESLTEVKTTEEDPQLELIPEPDKAERLEWKKLQEELLSSCFLENPDSSVIGIIIDDAISTAEILGEETRLGGDWTFRNLNADKTKYLNLTVHPGSFYNQVSIFEVGYTSGILKGDRFLNFKDFVTGKGVKLGLVKSEVIELFGHCFQTLDINEHSDNIVYRIELPQDTEDNFLARHNMPIYYAQYKFEKDVLIRYEFGFEYP